MRANVIEEAPVELFGSKAVVGLVEERMWGWVEVAFGCDKGVVAEGLEALNLCLEFETPSGPEVEEYQHVYLLSPRKEPAPRMFPRDRGAERSTEQIRIQPPICPLTVLTLTGGVFS